MDTGQVAVVIPAKDEEDRIAATVRAARSLPAVDVVVVVSDGSSDHTAQYAHESGAVTVQVPYNRGKASAMVAGADAVHVLDEAEHRVIPRHLLFLDADLGESAADAAPLIDPVLRGQTDMTIAVFPRTARGGGHGLATRLARHAILEFTGWAPRQPLSGQRCLTRAAFDAGQPLAAGFGVETGLTVDLLRAGFRAMEIPVPLRHRVTGKDLRSQLHRARQFRDIARAIATRTLPLDAVNTVRRLRHVPVAPHPL